MYKETLRRNKIKDMDFEGSNGPFDGSVKLYLDKPLERKKVSSTMFPKLYTDQKFSKKGDSVLEFFNLTNKEPFDDFYSLRGFVAEYIIQEVLRAKKYPIETFSLGDDLVRYSEDKSPVYKYFRGLPDILYTDGDGKRHIIEIKSKSLSKKEFVIDSPPETEIMQGKMLAVLEDLDEVSMTYVMFDDTVESMMKEAVKKCEKYSNECAYTNFMAMEPNLQLKKNYDIHVKKYRVDRKVVLDQMKYAYKYAETFRQTLKLERKDLSSEVWNDCYRVLVELEGNPPV